MALGLVGFAAGVIFKKVKPNRWLLAAIGFVLAFALYGVVVDASSVLTMLTDYTLSGVLAIYAAGVPFPPCSVAQPRCFCLFSARRS